MAAPSIEDEGSLPPTIEGVGTSIAAFVGWTAGGPAGTPTSVSGLADFDRLFGPASQGGVLARSVQAFFDNGGQDAVVLRLAGSGAAPLVPDTDDFEAALADPATGVAALAGGSPFSLLCVPGQTRAGPVLALQAFCEAHRAFLILDTPLTATAASLATSGPVDAAGVSLVGPSARNAAIYHPWVLTADPSTGVLAPFPPCGFVAGRFAAIDAQRGVWKAPAGTAAVLDGVADLVEAVDDAASDALAARGINVLRAFPVDGPLIWGARTLAGANVGDPDDRYVPVRRLLIYLESSLDAGLRWVVFEPNDPQTWARIRLAVGAFLNGMFRQGALAGTTPKDAYFVRCDDQTTTQADIDAGVVNLVAGIAPLKPAEFVIARFSLRAGSSA